MTDPSPNPELMRSLGRLVRGISALFWGMPAMLVVCVWTIKAETLQWFNVVPPLFCAGLLLFGLCLMGSFQKQERVWRNALDRACILGLVNLGLTPFLYWAVKIPNHPFFGAMVTLLGACGLLFLGSINLVLQRLGAMLPDEALRLEIRQFTALNLNLLGATLILGAAYVFLSHWPDPPLYLQAVMLVLHRGKYALSVLLLLLPLAMTMALLWKTKEVILESVFGAKS